MCAATPTEGPSHKTQLLFAAALYSAAAALVFVLAMYREHVLHRDIDWMKRPLLTLQWRATHQKTTARLDINVWTILHMLLYFALGVFAPTFWLLWVVIGVLWELFEWFVNTYLTAHVDYKFTDVFVNTVALVGGAVCSEALHAECVSVLKMSWEERGWWSLVSGV